ncbi:hypothetical protein ACJX0J_015326 [Zea mays]
MELGFVLDFYMRVLMDLLMLTHLGLAVPSRNYIFVLNLAKVIITTQQSQHSTQKSPLYFISTFSLLSPTLVIHFIKNRIQQNWTLLLSSQIHHLMIVLGMFGS